MGLTVRNDGCAVSSKPADPARQVIFTVLLLPVGICWALAAYYFFAQHLENPQPVTGSFINAKCEAPYGSGIRASSKPEKNIGDVEFQLITEYEFESRSESFNVNGTLRKTMDRKTHYGEMSNEEDCTIAAQQVNAERKSVTIWAGEDDIDSRFRARFTEAQEYPPLAMLWVPALIAFVGIKLWMRAMRKGAFQ
jgi:hypothetical protein